MTTEKIPPLFKLLLQIANDKEIFEYEIVEKIVKKIAPQLKDYNYENIGHSKNFTINGNIWAKLCLLNTKGNDLENNLKNPQLLEWVKIFSLHCPEILENAKFNLVPTYDNNFKDINFYNKNCSLNLISLLKQGIKIDLENFSKLDKDEKLLLMVDILNEEQSYVVYKNISKEHLDFSHILLKIIQENKEEIKLSFNLNDTKFFDYILKSKLLKVVISSADPQELQDLISNNELKEIFKKSSLKENILKNLNMLDNLLPLAAPEKWLNAIKGNKKELNLLALFDQKFFMLTGHDLYNTDTNYSPKKNAITGSKAMKTNLIKEFEYFMPALENEFIDPEKKIQWYKMLTLSSFTELLGLSAQIIELPKIDQLKDEKLKSKLKSLENLMENKIYIDINKMNSDCWTLYKQGRNIALAKKMDNNLSIKNNITKLKL